MKKTTIAALTLLLLAAPIAGAQADWKSALTEAMPEYQFGDPREPLEPAEEKAYALVGTPEQAAEFEQLIADHYDSYGVEAKRLAARWLGICGTERSVPLLKKALQDDDVAPTARWALARIPGEAAKQALAEDTQSQQQVQQGASRDIPGQNFAVLAHELGVAEAPRESKRLTIGELEAALSGQDMQELARKLLDLQKSDDQVPANQAQVALAALRLDGLNEALRTLVGQSAEPATQVAAIQALVARHDTEGARAIMMAGGEGSDEVHQAIVSAIEVLGDENALRFMVAILADPPAELLSDATRKRLPAAVGALSARVQPDASLLIERLNTTEDPEIRADIVRALGFMQTPQAYEAITGAVYTNDPAVQLAALAAINQWPPERALEVAHKVATSEQTRAKTQAVSVFLSKLKQAQDVPVAEKAQMLNDLAAQDIPEAQRSLFLSALPSAPAPEMLKLALDYVKDEAVRNEAALAALQIAWALRGSQPEAVQSAIETLQGQELADAQQQQLDALAQRVEQESAFLTSWQMAGPYQEEGVYGKELYDLPLPSQPEYQPLLMPAQNAPIGFVDLNAAQPHFESVALLQTSLEAQQAGQQKLTLQISDAYDLWLNGELISSQKDGGSLEWPPAEVALDLKQGQNDLKLAIYQFSGDWGFTARLEGDGAVAAATQQ